MLLLEGKIVLEFWLKVSVHENVKKELGEYPAILTEQAWSIKDLLYDQNENFFLPDQHEI